jgi:hypothetical protein
MVDHDYGSVANQIESEMLGEISQEELEIIDAAMASIDAGEVVMEAEIMKAFAKLRSA